MVLMVIFVKLVLMVFEGSIFLMVPVVLNVLMLLMF
jgi:hypothetical protein